MKKKWIWLAVLALMLTAAGTVAVMGLLLPWMEAESVLPDAPLVLRQQEDGSLTLSWSETEEADFYRVELLTPGEKQGQEELLFRGSTLNGDNFRLPSLEEGQELIFRVCAAVNYEDWFRSTVRYSRPIEATTRLSIPRLTDLQWEADADQGTVRVDVRLPEGEMWAYQLLDGEDSIVAEDTAQGGKVVLRFGSGGHPLPQYGSFYRLPVHGVRQETNLIIHAMVTREPVITREDLLGRDPKARLEEGYGNTVTITWEETKGTGYQVQILEQDSWNTLRSFGPQEERTYTTSRLMPYQTYEYRVVATGGQTMEDSEYAALSETLTVQPEETAIYATVWPIKALDAFSDPALTEAAGTVPALKALCVLEEQEEAFAVRVNGQVLWIDSRYCLINLPEYLGKLCAYQITNSYASRYMIHEFEIPKVTGKVTKGYECVLLEDGTYLAPLLYPTAQKLVNAAQAALEQGYRLKIYDSYRPNKATLEIYDLTEKILEEELPKRTYAGGGWTGLNLPAQEKDEEGNLIPLTYQNVMLGSSHELNHFLAKGGSLHNLGVALDLTLEDARTGQEMPMQSSMHDLSQYSTTWRNNENAKLLAQFMTGAGLNALSTEWWHFQDDQTRGTLSLPFAWEGVSGEGWMKDETGWRYRTILGTCLTGGRATIDETEYTFDQYGYVVTEE